ncbi:MAG: DUF2202 domain-containing protein [Bacteroidales bacterium]
MKRDFIKGTVVLISILAAFSCTKEQTATDSNLITPNTTGEIIEVKSTGATSFNAPAITAPFDSTADLTADEIEFLFAVREDEKLARDVYAIFYTKFQNKIFENIGKSESTHLKAIERLYDYYEIDYSAVGDAGKFTDPKLQHLYDSLIVKGDSLLAAVKIMANLEESNIFHYREVLKTITNTNIKIVIENLEKGSENHFKAAIRQITALGGIYTPLLLSSEDYKDIIAIGFEKGKRYKYHNNGQTNNQGKNINTQKGKRGAVTNDGSCNQTSNGSAPGTNNGKGRQGKGYRG